jgi:PAS domain S-box-containing protein
MYHFRSFHLRDMTACGASLRRLGADAKSLEEVADRLVRYLYRSFTAPRTGEPACALVRLFKTHPYCNLSADLRSLADKRLGTAPDNPFLPCLTLLSSAGAVPGWNDPALSSRYRVIPLGSPQDLEQLPMFSLLIRQLGVSLPDLGEPVQNLLLDSQEHTFNVFHILHAEGSPYVPAQEEFVRKYGIRSVLGFGAPLPDGELFSVILFSQEVISVSTAQLFKPLALCAKIALAPYADSAHSPRSSAPSIAPIEKTQERSAPVAHLHARISELEQLLTVHEQTVEAQANRIEMIVSGADMGTWDWDIPTGQVTWNERWARMIGYHLDDIEPHIRAWEQLIHPDDKSSVLAAVSAHLRGETPFYSSEYRLRARSGAWQWVFDSGRVLLRDGSGAPLRAAGIHLDISVRKGLEQAFSQSEERFRQLADCIDAVFWLTNADKSSLLYVSPAFESTWGFPRDLLYARPALWKERIHPEDRERINRAAASQAHVPYDQEYRIITPDGTIRWIRDRNFPVTDPNGHVYRVAGIAVDITVAKQMEENLRGSERRYRALVELSPLALFVNCEGLVAFANQACLSLLGAATPQQLIGRTVSELIHPESLALVQDRIANIRATGHPAPPIEERLVRLDGAVIDVEAAAAPITFEGKPAIQIIMSDISARKQLERALLSANLQLMAILDGATHVSMIATNREGMITTFNTGAERLLGYSAAEMVGEQPLTRLHVPAEIEQRAGELTASCGYPVEGVDVLIEHARQGGCEEREWTYLRKDGARLTVFLTVTALRNGEGTIAGFLAMGKDITSRKETEAALARAAHELERKNKELAQARDEAIRAAQLKTDFLATMSHEIRTPMNAIIGMTGLLLETALTEDQHEFADTVRRSSDALLTLVNDILDFSKIEAGKLHFEELAFDLRMTIEDTLELLADQAQGKGLELVGLVDAAVPAGVHGDPGRLRQILVNLVGNAIKFTSCGEVFLHVAREESGGPDLLRFTVTDTGIGIPEAVQARLFQAFIQADSSTTRRYGGTGLGLVICQRLVAQMQGSIGVESRPGKGSTFWFTARLPEATVAAAPSLMPWSRLRGRRVLVVDRNKTIRRAIQSQLAAQGMDCLCVASGSQAFDMARAAAARQQPFDAALIELHRSDMDGFETASRFKQDPATTDIRLVILTTIGHRGDGGIAQEVGVDAYLTKPLRQTQMLDCLCLLLGDPDGGHASGQAGSLHLITRHSLAEARTQAGTRLLLAEDNPVNQKVACKMLEKLGYRVDVAANGQEAVAAHERSPYPLIFMDCQMPEMDGLEATRLIRRHEQACDNTEWPTTETETQGAASRPAIHHSTFTTHHSPRHVPIIAMTANAMKGDREECLAAGMDDYVAKPIRLNDLRTILSTWLHGGDQAAAS